MRAVGTLPMRTVGTLPMTVNKCETARHTCGSDMLSCSLLLAGYECSNTSAAAVYDASLTTVGT